MPYICEQVILYEYFYPGELLRSCEFYFITSYTVIQLIFFCMYPLMSVYDA